MKARTQTTTNWIGNKFEPEFLCVVWTVVVMVAVGEAVVVGIKDEVQ